MVNSSRILSHGLARRSTSSRDHRQKKMIGALLMLVLTLTPRCVRSKLCPHFFAGTLDNLTMASGRRTAHCSQHEVKLHMEEPIVTGPCHGERLGLTICLVI